MILNSVFKKNICSRINLHIIKGMSKINVRIMRLTFLESSLLTPSSSPSDSLSPSYVALARKINTKFSSLKGSYDVAKKNIILCIWCNAMCLCGLMLKKHYFTHTVHYRSSMPHLSETRRFLQSSSFWEVMCALIGQKPQTVLAKLELPHFIETAFVHNWQATGNSPL